MRKILRNKFASTINWNFNFLDFPKSFKDKKDFNGLFGREGILNLYLESIDFPKYGLKFEDDSYFPYTSIFTGIFFEREDYIISKFFDTWNNLDNKRIFKEDQADSDIELLDSEGNVKSIYRVEGIFPINVSFVEKLCSDPNFQRVSVSFDFSKIYRIDK